MPSLNKSSNYTYSDEISDVYYSGNNTFLAVLFAALIAFGAAQWTGYVHVGSFDIFIYNVCFAAITVIGFVYFLIKPDFGRIKQIMRPALFFALSYLFPYIWSVFVWVVNGVSSVEMRKAAVGFVYTVVFLCAVFFMIYVAGEKAPWYYLTALIVGNAVIVIRIALENGIGTYLYQLWRLIITFTGETLELMWDSEVHGVTYALGVFLVYFCMNSKAWKDKIWLLIPTAFFYLTGLKRISVLALIVGVVFALLFKNYHKSHLKTFFLKFLGIAFIFAALLYVIAIRNGLMDTLESFGLDTNGRDYIYSTYEPYYEISLGFIGHGAGWVEAQYAAWYEALEYDWQEVYLPHNDYLWSYLELGMIGLMAWCYVRSFGPIQSVRKNIGDQAATICLAIVSYILIICMVEQVSSQVFTNQALMIIVLSYNLSEREKTENMNMLLNNRAISDF